MKFLPFIVSAVFVAVAIVLTMAVANSTTKQQTVTGTGGLHSAELMRLYGGNRRFDAKSLGCNTPLGEFDLSCTLAQHHVARSGDAD